LGEGAALQPLKQLILEKTEGNPFFMEEVVQTLAEEKVLIGERGHYRLERAPTELQIPTTVQGVLTARIDRLPPQEKTLLQTLAVIGKEFSLSLLRQVVDRPEDELHRLLSHLQTAEFIYEQPAFPEVEYTFKHALTQEVAYNSLLVERRRVLHERTARIIEALFGLRLEDHYSDLAHHYGRSGNVEKAVEYLQLAGHQAVQQSANTEAISYLTTALELLKTLPDTPERARQELTLQTTLGPALMNTKGYAAPEVEQAYTRARELCQQLGETRQLFLVLRGLYVFYQLRGELWTTRELAEHLLEVAQSLQDPAFLLEAHFEQGVLLVGLGEPAPARAHLEQAIALYDPQQHRSLAFLYGQDPGVSTLVILAQVLWFLGYPDQALKRSQEGLTLAQELSHPFSLARALFFKAWLHQVRREGRAAQELAEAALILATEHGFTFRVALGTIMRGWALAEQGQTEEGIMQMREGLAAYRATGAELARSHFLALLAEMHGKVGQAEEGLILLAEALDVVHRTGEHWWEVELYRLKGELLQKAKACPERSRRGKGQKAKIESEAEECFQKAIEIARRQSAKSLELRAVMSLGRLWQKQGKKEEARQMLAEIYSWFTEGFGTKDLQEAKMLLQELA
jgi:predicted ATPase